MPFYYKHPAGKFDLEDLPLERWIAIQADTGMAWPEILTGKVLGDVKVAQAVVREVVAHLGIDAPALTLRTLLESVIFEPGESVPEQYNDGVPDPKAQASEPVTT